MNAFIKLSPRRSTSGYTLPEAALAFALAHPAVGAVIPGMRNAAQAEANCAASARPPLPEALAVRLRAHNWRRHQRARNCC